MIGQLIALVRHIAHTDHLLRTGVLTEVRAQRVRERADVIWRPADPDAPIPYQAFRGRELRTLTLGLLGFGAVARRVAAEALALDMRVLAHDPFVASPGTARVRLVELGELLAGSHVVSLHARGSDVLVGRAELCAMRPGAFLINTARGAILDYPALVGAGAGRRASRRRRAGRLPGRTAAAGRPPAVAR